MAKGHGPWSEEGGPRGMVLGVKREARCELLISRHKCNYLTQVVSSFDFNYR